MSNKRTSELKSAFLNTKEDRRMAIRVLDELARGAVGNGFIEPALDIESRRDKFLELWPKLRRQTYFSVDHTPTVLRYAHECKRAGHHEIAVLLYATVCEQKINLFVSVFATRAGVNSDQVPKLIRDTNFDARCTWLLQILKAPAIAAVHLKRLRYLMNLRNEFVHYKWKGEWGYDSPKPRPHSDLLQFLPATFRYLARYEQKNLYYGATKQPGRKRPVS
jgi:coproporphyrinogen III oxidase